MKEKINLKEFLDNQNINCGIYALVTYDNKTEPTYFSKYNFGDGDWYLESPCCLYQLCEITKPIEEFAKEYVDELLEEDANKEEYIEQFVKPMIIDNILYEIENFQCLPYLPKEVDDIRIITERECLKYLLK